MMSSNALRAPSLPLSRIDRDADAGTGAALLGLAGPGATDALSPAENRAAACACIASALPLNIALRLSADALAFSPTASMSSVSTSTPIVAGAMAGGVSVGRLNPPMALVIASVTAAASPAASAMLLANRVPSCSPNR